MTSRVPLTTPPRLLLLLLPEITLRWCSFAQTIRERERRQQKPGRLHLELNSTCWTTACFTLAFRSAGVTIKEKHLAWSSPAWPGPPQPGLLGSIRMFWKNVAWSWSGSVGDDGGGAYLLAADVRRTPDVSPAADLTCPGATSTTAAGPDRTKVQSPVRSSAPVMVNHQHLHGDSKCSSFGSAPCTAANQEAKRKSDQWLLVSHMTQVISFIRTIKGQVRTHGLVSLVGVTPGVYLIGECFQSGLIRVLSRQTGP